MAPMGVGRWLGGVARPNNKSLRESKKKRSQATSTLHKLYLFVDFTKIGCVFYYYAKLYKYFVVLRRRSCGCGLARTETNAPVFGPGKDAQKRATLFLLVASANKNHIQICGWVPRFVKHIRKCWIRKCITNDMLHNLKVCFAGGEYLLDFTHDLAYS